LTIGGNSAASRRVPSRRVATITKILDETAPPETIDRVVGGPNALRRGLPSVRHVRHHSDGFSGASFLRL